MQARPLLGAAAVAALSSLHPYHAHGQALSLGRVPVSIAHVVLDTCNLPNAGTNDPVFLDIQRGDSKYTYVLDNPGNDREKGDFDMYSIPGFGPLDNITAITIRKEGNDAWCFEKAYLVPNDYQGAIAGFTRPSGMNAGQIKYVGAFGVTDTQIWLDGEPDQAPASFFRMSDVRIYYDAKQVHKPVTLGVRTCANTPKAGTDATVVLHYQHDGIRDDVVLNNSGDDREEGDLDTYVISPVGGIGSIQNLALEVKGSDEWCVSELRLGGLNIPTGKTWIVDGQKTFITTSIGGFAGSADGLGFPYHPLRRGGSYAAANAILADKDAETHGWYSAICELPRYISAYTLEGVIGTVLAGEMRKKDAFWGDGYSSLSYVDSKTLRGRVRFEMDGGPWNDDTFWINFDLKLSCSQGAVKFTPENTKVTYDLSPKHDWKLALGLFGAFFSDQIEKKVENALGKIYHLGDRLKEQGFEVGDECPIATFTTSADLKLDWTPVKKKWSEEHFDLPFPNAALCLKSP